MKLPTLKSHHRSSPFQPKANLPKAKTRHLGGTGEWISHVVQCQKEKRPFLYPSVPSKIKGKCREGSKKSGNGVGVPVACLQSYKIIVVKEIFLVLLSVFMLRRPC